MDIELLDEGSLQQYHTFLGASPTGDVLQSAAWARLKAGSGWTPHFFAGKNGTEISACCLALERRLPRLPFGILYCPRGPVLDWQDAEGVRQMTDALYGLAKRRRCILVKVDPAITGDEARHALLQAGFRPGGSGGFGGVQPRCVMKLDLSEGLDAAFNGFKPKWRYNIRLAERKGVTVREGGREDLDAFYEVLLETARRDRFLVRGRQYFVQMWDELSKDGYIRLFLTYHENRLIAGAILFILGRQAWYVYGASSNESRNVMPNHLMQWRMMEAAAEAGCTVYDFRGVSCREDGGEDDHLQGLNRFKAGFNADFVEYVGEYDLPVNSLMYSLWTRGAPKVMSLLKRSKARAEAVE